MRYDIILSLSFKTIFNIQFWSVKLHMSCCRVSLRLRPRPAGSRRRKGRTGPRRSAVLPRPRLEPARSKLYQVRAICRVILDNLVITVKLTNASTGPWLDTWSSPSCGSDLCLAVTSLVILNKHLFQEQSCVSFQSINLWPHNHVNVGRCGALAP